MPWCLDLTVWGLLAFGLVLVALARLTAFGVGSAGGGLFGVPLRWMVSVRPRPSAALVDENRRRLRFSRRSGKLAFFCRLWYAHAVALSKNGGGLPSFSWGQLLSAPLIYGKGGCPMVTYSDLIQIGILIVGIISLIIQANNKKK